MSRRIRHLIVVGIVVVVPWGGSCGSGGSPASNPPPIVEYETLQLSLAGHEGTDAGDAPDPDGPPGVGGPSILADMARRNVATTNRAFRAVFDVLERIEKTQPTVREGVYTWGADIDGTWVRFSSQRRTRNHVEYGLWMGDGPDAHERVLSGSFTEVRPDAVTQQGFGRLRFDFDALSQATEGAWSGEIAVGYRRVGAVKQLRVLRSGFGRSDGAEWPDALERYVRGPEERARFRFFARRDMTDGQGKSSREFVRVHAVADDDGAGRAAAGVEQGDLERAHEVEVCWGAGQNVVWAHSEPELDGYTGGDRDGCEPELAELDVEAPSYEEPGDARVEVPDAHPAE